MTCPLEQTIGYAMVQTPDAFPQCQSFITRTDWNSEIFWTMNTQNFSTLQVFQSFSHKCKSLFLKSCPKEFIRFLFEGIVNRFKENLQSIKRHHVTNFQNEIWLLFLEKITWKQKRDVLVSAKWLILMKVITLPIINHLSWYGAVCLSLLLCTTTTVWILMQLQSRSFQSLRLNKVPCINLIR